MQLSKRLKKTSVPNLTTNADIVIDNTLVPGSSKDVSYNQEHKVIICLVSFF